MQVITETTQQMKQRNKADKMRKSEKRKEKVKALKIGKKVKLLALVVGFFGVGLGVKSFFDWTNSNQVEFRNPLTIAVQSPVVVTPKKLNVVETVNQIVYGEDVVEIEKGSVEDMIINEFGKDAPTALAVFNAESGLQQDAWNCNVRPMPNGELCTSSWCAEMSGASLDIGTLQINYESHKAKPECSWESITTLEGNIKCGKAVFAAAGNTFNPWVAAHKLGLVN